MTTHTNLIARLRSGWTTDRLLAANALESLEQQVAELVATLEIAVKLNSFREFNDHIPAMKEALAKVKQP